ncbi:hypothetical protein FHS57_003255 [Runella defluvii]|uniref:Uncharacterized protein n=1 Tax=Runella defluvii TaxID=370973 RepID=A0A7W6ER27_9BACT|nr:hypothetical protein [Runella defluvii]
MFRLYRGYFVFKAYTKKSRANYRRGIFYTIGKTYFLGALYVILYNVPFKSSVT